MHHRSSFHAAVCSCLGCYIVGAGRGFYNCAEATVGRPNMSCKEVFMDACITEAASLQVLDGASITARVRLLADATFRGRLLPETLALQLGHRRFELIAELELLDLGLRSVDDVFGSRGRFLCLVHLKLDGNQLTQVNSCESSQASMPAPGRSGPLLSPDDEIRRYLVYFKYWTLIFGGFWSTSSTGS